MPSDAVGEFSELLAREWLEFAGRQDVFGDPSTEGGKSVGRELAVAQAGLEFADQVFERPVKRGLFGGVVAEEGAGRYAGRSRDVGDLGLVNSPLDEKAQRAVVKRAASLTLARLAASLGDR